MRGKKIFVGFEERVFGVAPVECRARHLFFGTFALAHARFGSGGSDFDVIIPIVDPQQRISRFDLIVRLREDLDDLARNLAGEPDLAVLRLDVRGRSCPLGGDRCDRVGMGGASQGAEGATLTVC